MAHIDGETQLVGLIGYPIDYTLSPLIHNEAFGELGLNWVYVPLRVPPGMLEVAMRGLSALGFKGANVTIPHKVEAVDYLDRVEGDAEHLGAVNTVSCREEGLVGYNTDVEGFARSIREAGINVEGESALVIGAGGAARAVVLALARMGASVIYLANRTRQRAEELASRLKGVIEGAEISIRTFDQEGLNVGRECGVVVNCTPLAVGEEGEIPIDYSVFRGGQWAVDLNYYLRATAFLRAAEARGARTLNGEGMFIHQAALSFRIWTGKEAPLEAMKRALRKGLGRIESQGLNNRGRQRTPCRSPREKG